MCRSGSNLWALWPVLMVLATDGGSLAPAEMVSPVVGVWRSTLTPLLLVALENPWVFLKASPWSVWLLVLCQLTWTFGH